MHSLRGPIKRPESREEVQDQRHERSNSRWPVTTVTHGNDPNSVSCTIKSCQKVLIIIMHTSAFYVWRAAKPHQPRLDDLTTVSHINVYQDVRNPQSFR